MASPKNIQLQNRILEQAMAFFGASEREQCNVQMNTDEDKISPHHDDPETVYVC